MRYQRLIIESGSNAVTVRFHPRLTVVSGVGRLERESLIGELTGALDGSRRDVHLEVAKDNGDRYGFLREGHKADRVIDIAANKDATVEFKRPDGIVDLAWRLGFNAKTLIQKSRIDPSIVSVLSNQDEKIGQIASVDQGELWLAAERLQLSELVLEEESVKVGATREDAMLLDEVERRHNKFESALRSYEIARHYSIFIGGSCAIAGVPAALMTKLAGLAFISVAAATTFASIVARRHMEKARLAEQQALASAGAKSYMGFYVQRVSKVLRDENARDRVANAAREHTEALEAWEALVGDTPLQWVVQHRADIERGAKRLAELRAKGLDLSSEVVPHDIDPAELAQALIVRISELRKIGDGGESLPLLLDESLLGVESTVKVWVLDLIARSAGSLQIIYLTEDPEVIEWAKREVASGHSTMVELAPQNLDEKPHLSIVA
jgi:hypothetical protein